MVLRLFFALVPVLLSAMLFVSTEGRAESIYRWVDEEGVLHLSSEKPPKGVTAERITVRSKPSQPPSSGGSASAQQIAGRRDVLGNLQLRECVIALEGLDRLTSGTQATDAGELSRLQQTVDRNCSSDPAQRRMQEEMAEKLRIANSAQCVEAREELTSMLAAGSKSDVDQVRVQQDFVAQHCTPPVR